MTLERVQQRRTKGWRKPEGAVSVVRGTEWGNPFKVGSVLDLGDFRLLTVTPALAVALYEVWLDQTYGPGIYAQIKHELGGKALMCYCRPGEPCHADLLMRIARGCPHTMGANPTNDPDWDRCDGPWKHDGDHGATVLGERYVWATDDEGPLFVRFARVPAHADPA